MSRDIKQRKFYVVSLNYQGGGEDTICYSRRECYKATNEYLLECRLRQINGTISTTAVEIPKGDFTEQSFFDGFVDVIHSELLEGITFSIK